MRKAACVGTPPFNSLKSGESRYHPNCFKSLEQLEAGRAAA